MDDIKKTDDKVVGEPKQDNLLRTLLIILVIVILFGGGYFVYTNYYQSSSTPEPVTLITPTRTPTATATATVSTTATVGIVNGLKTYTNTTYGFTFRYPESLTVADSTKDLTILTDDNIYKQTGTVETVSLSKVGLQGPVFAIWIMNKSIDNAIQTEHSEFGTKNGQPVTIGGVVGEKLTGAFYGMEYISKNNMTYFFRQDNFTDTADNTTYNQIVSTLTFTN